MGLIQVTAHTFRRSCTTEVFRGGANMYDVKEMLGHESLDTLEHCAKLTVTELMETHRTSLIPGSRTPANLIENRRNFSMNIGMMIERISIDPAICHGKPCIKGTRIMVDTVLGLLADGYDFNRIREGYP